MENTKFANYKKYLVNEKYSMFLCITVFVMYSIVYMSKNCFAAAIAAIVSEKVMSKTQTGTIIAMFWLFYAIFQIPGGMLSNKYKPERLVFLGVVGSGLANLLLYFFHNYYAMIIIWSLNAIIQLGVWPSTFRILSKELHKNHRRNASYYIPMTFILGIALSYVFAAIVKKWEENFLISSVLLLISGFAFIIIYKFIDKKGGFVQDEETLEINEKKDNNRLCKSLIESGILIIIPAFVIQFFVSNGIKVFAPVMLTELFPNLSVSVSNLLSGVISISTAFGILFLNFFYPKRIKSSTVTITVMFGIALTMNVVLIYAQKISWVIFFLTIVMALIPLTAITQFINVLIPKKFAKDNCDVSVAGILNAVASFGILISSYAVGELSDNYNWTTVFIIFTIMLIIAILLVCIANNKWNIFASEK